MCLIGMHTIGGSEFIEDLFILCPNFYLIIFASVKKVETNFSVTYGVCKSLYILCIGL